jgi:peptidoglycan/LPS O-acetylase OafA/YrhL
MLFRFSAERHSVPEPVARRICFLALALMFFVPSLDGVKYALPLGSATTYGITFALFAFSLMYWRNSLLIGKTVVWIGKVSYSAYFVHFAVLHYLPPFRPTGVPSADVAIMYAVVAASTVAISSITYLIIERPMIRIGSALIAARRSLAFQPAQA